MFSKRLQRIDEDDDDDHTEGGGIHQRWLWERFPTSVNLEEGQEMVYSSF
jgi:hypothetical protein